MTDTNTADTTTALFAAIDSGNEDRVIELINAGADIFATDAEGASTLTHAQRQGNEIIIQTLQMMAEAQGKEFQDAPDDGDAKDAAGEEEPDDGTTVLTDSVDVPEIEEGFFVEPDAIVLDEEFKERWLELSRPEWLMCLIGTFSILFILSLLLSVVSYIASWESFEKEIGSVCMLCLCILVILLIINYIGENIRWSNLKEAIRTRGFGEAVRYSYYPGNDFEMLYWMARSGDVTAVSELADRHMRGEDGAFYSPRRAVALYIYAAGEGSFWAKRQLSECYEKGIGVEPNPAEAARWRDRAEKARAAEL